MTHDFIDKFKSTHGRLPSQVEISKELKISSQKAIMALIQYSKEVKVEEEIVEQPKEDPKIKTNWTLVALRIILALLSAMAVVLSIYFTGLWFMGRFSVVISGLISLSMVLFMVIAPQTMRFVANRFVKIVVGVSFFIALLFSMGSTIAGQYNKTSERIENEPDKAYIFNQLDTSEAETLSLIEEAQKDKVVHQEAILMLSTSEEARKANWQSIATERKYIASFDSRIDELRIELKSIRQNKLDNGVVEEKRDFYSFISGLTGMEQSFIEFLISALPAIFIDVISALCVNLLLFIKE